MIIPSIDLQDGRAVQLRQGKDHLLTDPRDPVQLAAELGRYGPVAVVDLDAALGLGDNRPVIEGICRVARCRVGGGIRSEDQVRGWIRTGAEKVMIGTRATPEFLQQFPAEWIIACLDARGQEVVVKGWTETAGATVLDRATQLAPYCSEFLFTQVEREGMLEGPDLATARRLCETVDLPITVAGGIRNPADIVELEQLNCNSQVGRALYEGKLDLADVWVEAVRFDADGLVPIVVQDDGTDELLMVAYGNARSLEVALREGVGCYWSRSRQELWRKGATSGNVQQLVAARWDCDRDTIQFRVRQTGPACHTGRRSCFAPSPAPALVELERTLESRREEDHSGSYTRRLFASAELLAAKLREETEEVIEATEKRHLTWECADLLYHLMVRMRGAQISVDDVAGELRSRFRPRPSRN